MTDADRQQYFDRLEQLESFGHRGSATENERHAAAYLVDERGLGLTPALEPVVGCRSMGLRLGTHGLLLLAAVGCLWVSPWLTIIVSLITVASLIVESATKGIWLSRPWVRFPTANVTATIGCPEPRLRVVVLAHYDTQRTGFIWWMFPWFNPWFWYVPTALKSPLYLVALLGFSIAGLASGILAGAVDEAMRDQLATTCAGYAIFFSVLMLDWGFGRYVPGAGDNASGVSAVLTLASAWLREPIDNVELIVLSPCCEETGLLGTSTWADRHRSEIDELPTVFLNLDTFGFGPPRFLGAEVPFCGFAKSYPPRMLGLAKQTANECGLVNAGPHSVSGPTDGLALLARRLQAITVVSFGQNGALPNYHRPQDTSDRLDRDAAWTTVEFSWSLLQRMAGAVPEIEISAEVRRPPVRS